MPTPFCQDFQIQIGKNTITVHFDFKTTVCVGLVVLNPFVMMLTCIFEFRDFINERRYESVTSIVNEFQYFFAIRRQRAFWIIESMLDPRWCVLEVVFDPGCISNEEYTEVSIERKACFEALIDRDDLITVFTELISMTGIKPLTHCGPGASYALRTRYVPLSETECDMVETNYSEWLRLFEELESYVHGG